MLASRYDHVIPVLTLVVYEAVWASEPASKRWRGTQCGALQKIEAQTYGHPACSPDIPVSLYVMF
jgi:hypothetical protein